MWQKIEGDENRVKWDSTPESLRDYLKNNGIADFTDEEWADYLKNNPDLSAQKAIVLPKNSDGNEPVPVTVLDMEDPLFKKLVTSEEVQKLAADFIHSEQKRLVDAERAKEAERKPMLGMTVVYRETGKESVPAIVTKINGDGSVNLFVVFDMGGFFNIGNVTRDGENANWVYPWELD